MDTKFLCDDYNCGDDFYNFVNNNWIKSTNIPDEYQSWGTFQILRENTSINLEKLIIKSNSSTNKNYQKLGLIYKQLIDGENKTSPYNYWNIQKILAEIESCVTISELLYKVFDLDLNFGINMMINLSIQPCFLNSSINIIHISSSGLGLPDKSYYLDTDKQSIREEYLKFIKDYSLLFNKNINPDIVFNLEHKIATKTYSSVQKRNPDLQNNLTTWDDLITKCPNLIFMYKLFERTNKKPGIINNTNPVYTQFINDMIDVVPVSSWKQFFIFKIIIEFNNFLGDNIKQCYFNFYERLLSGTKKMKTESKLAVDFINGNLGELLGQLYVENYFNSESKTLALNIFKYVRNELKNYLTSNDWMENVTKSKAIQKLDSMNIKIGYPDKYFKDYDKLYINESNSLIQNILIIRKFNIKYKIEKLYEPVNKFTWGMNPQSVNAYYSPSMNEIVFPAGILQKPIFSIGQDIASNFGGFGMVIGHEITHGFDDQGSKFDYKGRLNNWWTFNDKIKYKQKIDLIRKQYAKYKIEDQYINSNLTLGENIADIGGLSLSYNALCSYMKYNPNENIIINGLNSKKRFFINYAILWKSKARKEDIIKKLNTDPHSPPEFRVNGVIRNIDAFYEIFDIKSDNKLYLEPDSRAKIWS
jgi:predicted metalloendopeptidase